MGWLQLQLKLKSTTWSAVKNCMFWPFECAFKTIRFLFIWIHKQNYIISRGIFCDLFIWLHFRQIIPKSIKQKHFILLKNLFMFRLKLNSSLFSVYPLKTPERFMAQYCTINVKYDWMQRWPIDRQRFSFNVLHSICNGYFSICFCSFVFFLLGFPHLVLMTFAKPAPHTICMDGWIVLDILNAL